MAATTYPFDLQGLVIIIMMRVDDVGLLAASGATGGLLQNSSGYGCIYCDVSVVGLVVLPSPSSHTPRGCFLVLRAVILALGCITAVFTIDVLPVSIFGATVKIGQWLRVFACVTGLHCSSPFSR